MNMDDFGGTPIFWKHPYVDGSFHTNPFQCMTGSWNMSKPGGLRQIQA